jgi:phosphoglycerate dehydrogenase-like enzyme
VSTAVTHTNVLIASYLETTYVERIRAEEGVRVVYEASLLPTPRYTCDHVGNPLQRSPADEARWREHLAWAEVMFDFDYPNLRALAGLIPNVRWIQATSTGIGQTLVRSGLIDAPIVFTTARGVHAGPLADFALMALLWFAKDGFLMMRDQAAHRWQRYCGRRLKGKTLAVIGLGTIGREVARYARFMGMHVIATRRDAEWSAGLDGVVDRLVPTAALTAVLPEADFVVLAVPHTPDTEGLIGAKEIDSMKRGAVVINVARGAVIDEPAMTAALQDGRLGGAALDVFSKEPPEPANPLWNLPNVLISPHSASTVDSENAALTDLFCENLRRYRRGETLVNVFDRERLY